MSRKEKLFQWQHLWLICFRRGERKRFSPSSLSTFLQLLASWPVLIFPGISPIRKRWAVFVNAGAWRCPFAILFVSRHSPALECVYASCLQAIPKGTLLAIVTTTGIYLGVVWLTGTTCVRDASGLMAPALVDSGWTWDYPDCAWNSTCEYGLLNYFQVSAAKLIACLSISETF